MNIPCPVNKERLKLATELEFINGIPGFEQYTKYMILQHDDDFSILQSIENKDIAFIITNPFLFFKDYEFELTDHDVEQLGVTSEEDITVRSIVTWGNDTTQVTTNLSAPLIFNVSNWKCKQIILFPTKYHAKHPLFGSESGLESEVD